MTERIGQQLGNCRLIRLVGEGGFATVYLGEHVYLKTQAAVKVLELRLTADNLEGFLTEARIIAGLKAQTGLECLYWDPLTYLSWAFRYHTVAGMVT